MLRFNLHEASLVIVRLMPHADEDEMSDVLTLAQAIWAAMPYDIQVAPLATYTAATLAVAIGSTHQGVLAETNEHWSDDLCSLAMVARDATHFSRLCV